jgi:hypothetical protein
MRYQEESLDRERKLINEIIGLVVSDMSKANEISKPDASMLKGRVVESNPTLDFISLLSKL